MERKVHPQMLGSLVSGFTAFMDYLVLEMTGDGFDWNGSEPPLMGINPSSIHIKHHQDIMVS